MSWDHFSLKEDDFSSSDSEDDGYENGWNVLDARDDHGMASSSKRWLWRGDPLETHSDWTIIVSTTTAPTSSSGTGDNPDMEQPPPQSYHVHKNILAAGAHSCKYFATLFHSPAAGLEQQDRTSRITLESHEVQAFALFLNFVYSPLGTEIHGVSAERALALRSLARYFQCRKLMSAVNLSIQKKLSTLEAVELLRAAHELNDDKVQESARRILVDFFDVFHGRHGPFDDPDRFNGPFYELPEQVFFSVVCSPDLDPKHHARASSDVKVFFQRHPQLLTARRLKELTSTFTEIAPFAAEGLLQMIETLDPAEDEENWVALDGLARRCADALAVTWRDTNTAECIEKFENPSVAGNYHGSGRVIVRRLASALDRARALGNDMTLEGVSMMEEIDSLRAENRYQQRVIGELEAQLERETRRRVRMRVHP